MRSNTYYLLMAIARLLKERKDQGILESVNFKSSFEFFSKDERIDACKELAEMEINFKLVDNKVLVFT